MVFVRNGGSSKETKPTIQTFAVLPPDGGWGWVVVASAFYCNVVIDGILFTFGMYLPELVKVYDTSEFVIALVGSLMFGVHLAAGPLCAGLSSGFGLRPVAVFGAFLSFFALACVGLEPPLWLLMILLGFVAGIGMCFVYMASIAVTTMYFSHYRVVAMGIVVCGTGAGTVIFASAGTSMLKIMSWQQAFVVLSVCALFMSLAAMTFRPLEPVPVTTESVAGSSSNRQQSLASVDSVWDDDVQDQTIFVLRRESSNSTKSVLEASLQASNAVFSQLHQRRQFFNDDFCRFCRRCCSLFRSSNTKVLIVKSGRKTVNDQHKTKRLWNIKKYTPYEQSQRWKKVFESFGKMDWNLLKSPKFFLFCLSGGIVCSSIMIIFTFEHTRATMFGDEYSGDIAVQLVMVIGTCNMLWRLFLGFVALYPCVNYNVLNVTGHCIAGIVVIASSFINSPVFSYIYAVLFALGLGCYAVFRPIILVELVGREKLPNATGISLLFMGVAAIIGPPFVGWIAKVTKNVAIIYWISGTCFVLSGILMIFTKSEKSTVAVSQPTRQDGLKREETDLEQKTEKPVVVKTIEEIMRDPREEFQVILNSHPEVIKTTTITPSQATA